MKKLVAYITTGYPDLDFTEDAALALKEAGVDTLELGVPFSDPVADGPVIEKANLISLQNGFKMEHLLDVSEKIAAQIDTLWMGYFNPFYHRGLEKITQEAQDRRISGFIIPDLPHEEAISYKELFSSKNLALIDFVAPTDSKERIAQVISDAQKFIYLVAYTGITGTGKSEDLSRVIEHIRQVSQTDIYIGFGVNEKSAKSKAKDVDGVIVGSAFVSILLDDDTSYTEKITKIQNMARNIKEAINS
ncbi:MAG: tryptophan synthase subunit alpha [Sulfurospirillum sp.]|nr:MAG: tryptophan synthase subunit alpha [Sulfurospirillum sp.]